MSAPGSGTHDVGAFISAEWARLVALAYTIVGSTSEAEDIVQDVAARLLRTDLSQVTNVGAYVRRSIVNECVAWRRRAARKARGASRLEREVQRLHNTGPDPYQRTEIASALNALPARHRAAVVLHYYLGWTDEDVAATFGCAPATVRSWRSRGLARLETELGK